MKRLQAWNFSSWRGETEKWNVVVMSTCTCHFVVTNGEWCSPGIDVANLLSRKLAVNFHLGRRHQPGLSQGRFGIMCCLNKLPWAKRKRAGMSRSCPPKTWGYVFVLWGLGFYNNRNNLNTSFPLCLRNIIMVKHSSTNSVSSHTPARCRDGCVIQFSVVKISTFF